MDYLLTSEAEALMVKLGWIQFSTPSPAGLAPVCFAGISLRGMSPFREITNIWQQHGRYARNFCALKPKKCPESYACSLWEELCSARCWRCSSQAF